MLVSVVMTAFNAATTADTAIRSVLGQSHTNIELLVCDDASSDGTGDVVRSVRDSRVRLVTNATNLGPGPSRNRLLPEARGEWIAFCDADDAWQPDRLATLLAAIGDDARSVVFDDILYCHHTPSGLQPWRRMRGARAFGARGQAVPVATAALVSSVRMLIKPMFSRVLLQSSGARHSTHAFGEDTSFLLKLLAGGGQLVYVPQPLYLYRITPGSASASPMRHRMLAEILREATRDFSRQPDVQVALTKKIARIERDARYLPFLDAVKAGDAGSAMRLAARHPGFVALFLARAARELPYQLHRLAHAGATRASQGSR